MNRQYKSPATLILLIALNLWPLAARAELVEFSFAGGDFTHKAGIAPGKFLEVCGKLRKDQRIAWQFTGSAATDFNIHYHVGKDVVYPEQRKATDQAEGALVVPLDQTYCWMWSNKSAQTVQLDVKLKEASVATGKTD